MCSCQAFEVLAAGILALVGTVDKGTKQIFHLESQTYAGNEDKRYCKKEKIL
jgi:hypothetical protein